ncbi:pimeloyl-CoA dehydrogenase small subunit [Sphingomonas ginkgonis]|uniref:Pimeloyl-CoA dehydrogenase small subunit n=1 Tax=Sphingomonas ginkgonis TaxID=2315330 RepID=A0A429VB02_9SPHN|nr:acyl-CoA dehydrogenase [Sphingomonas ginkgonis]RST31126.1 pimeloyl-CoA dehydrogenase small subunit [Sphingomonas ginkgonis]
MDFSLGDDRQMLSDTLRRFLADTAGWKEREAAAESPEGFSRSVWRGLAELGALGALFPEEQGGYGGSPFDVGVLFAELGRALVTGPFRSALVAGRLLGASGETDELAALIAGERLIGFAHDEPTSADDPLAIGTCAEQRDGGWTLTGDKAVVPYAAALDALLVVARAGSEPGDEESLSLFLVERGAPGLEIRDYPLIDGGSGGEVALRSTPARLVGTAGGAWPLLEEARALGVVALAWEAVAIMDVLRDSTLDYLRTRKQFGVPIGKFQALQHRMATVALEIEQARSAAINAADRFTHGRIERERAAAAAKVTIGRAGMLAAEEAIQLHGGIGMTWELPLSHYAKRLVMLAQEDGDEDVHLSRYIALGTAA